jgi:hypothetical protein
VQMAQRTAIESILASEPPTAATGRMMISTW